ncbi:ribonuclease R [Parvibaculum sp.]|uniref:ribonuclease R n=1 Tax=Parvibaculum sp. TaxID=2024848 RepID=UPI001D4B2759|nr:ribonuclease R [Parvibaculum sp.]MBX3488170.1 ribonuclease R [Parvibaculum sp.]MCW5727852.1 ribonuclease R [Parvibaculum sp.]
MAERSKPKKSGAGKKRKSGGHLPSRDDILKFIAENGGKLGKREIGRAFGIKGDDRLPFKQLLKELKDEGLIAKDETKSLRRVGELPPVTVIEITHTDIDGDLIARPVSWPGETPPPQIVVTPDMKRRGKHETVDEPPAGVGDRVLARIEKTDDETWPFEARVIRRVGKGAERIMGLFRRAKGAKVARLIPVDKKVRVEFEIGLDDAQGAEDGNLVLAETIPGKRYGTPRARVREVFGDSADPRSISLIAIHTHGIPDAFPDDVIAEAEAAKHHGLKGRTDLRDIPLITIDPPDARDHDDAVWAAPDDDPKNEGGVVAIVAIADVAAYVKPGSPMDREARKRGNSTYFPDRVVPMLPERISNDLCSLVDGEDRACFAVRMVFDRNGQKRGHEFIRGLMRSAASLSYKQVQQAIDGRPDDVAGPLLEPVLKPLWAAYRILAKAREARGPLDLDMPEYKIDIDAEGRIGAIRIGEKHESMKLIEEFMIQANVCAAESAEAKRRSVIYRIHDAPTREKLVALAEFLATLNLSFAKGETVRPANFNRILKSVDGTEHDRMVSDVILRSQAQAVYSPDNIGHFGLNLRRYAHFTSPIRRYADLTVHRALVASLDFGKDGQTDDEAAGLVEIAEHISMTERRSMLAERDSKDRFIAAFLEARIGAEFRGRVAGVTRFGLFVKLDETGADGFVPISTLGGDFFHHDEILHALIGERTGLTYRLGDGVLVRLVEAVPITGGLRLELLEGGSEGKPAGRGGNRRPAPRRGPPRGKPGAERKAKSRR